MIASEITEQRNVCELTCRDYELDRCFVNGVGKNLLLHQSRCGRDQKAIL